MPADEVLRAKFPHLLPGEVTVWRSFLTLYQTQYDRFEYDVHLGAGSLPQENTPSKYGQDFRYLTLKRADVVGWQRDQATIFEVRARGSLPLMGQLLGYRALWMRQNESARPPLMAMVCTFMQPDDQDIFEQNEIAVVIVPEVSA